jgi:hypothetical protein
MSNSIKKKRIKCIKCGLYFKDREDPADEELVHKTLCWNCRFIWNCLCCLGMVIHGFPERLNRTVGISLDGVQIQKKNHFRESTKKVN